MDLPREEKVLYIFNTATSLINKLEMQYGTQVTIDNIQMKLDKLVNYNNLRDIKRKIEDIVMHEFFNHYVRV